MESGTKHPFCYTTAALSAEMKEGGADATAPGAIPPTTGETLNQGHGSSLLVRSLGILSSYWKPPSHILSQCRG